MNDNKMLFIKGSLFEQTDLLLIESTVLLGYLINFQNINPIFHKDLAETGKQFYIERKKTKKVTFTRAKTEEEKQRKKEKKDRRNRELISLSGLLKLAKVFDLDDDVLRGYLLQFRNLDEANKKICQKQGKMYFEKHKEQKQQEKLEKDRKKRLKEEAEEKEKNEFFERQLRELQK